MFFDKKKFNNAMTVKDIYANFLCFVLIFLVTTLEEKTPKFLVSSPDLYEI